MIDLHSHILPAIDDGSKNLEMSLEMARIAVADGITVMACTPHIYPGVYLNDTQGIQSARDALQQSLDAHGIPLKLVIGADVHLVPELIPALKKGVVPPLNGTRYLLLEPSHHIVPPHFSDMVFNLVASGYVPVITHPERLTWIEDHYPLFAQLVQQGAWMQVTASALTGMFGPRAKYWGERFIGDGLTHILATDAHSSGRRVPVLSAGLAVAERLVGRDEAQQLVVGRPDAILRNVAPADTAPLRRPRAGLGSKLAGIFRRSP
ncbi:tyrosine-protein phosphatase [Caenimonas sp. SL110]|uniref:tyrosine-protein phosphatase n=1 Tax=Caenimonas sp. SL110 TaxID=1450524 RepID=UPI000653CBB4|nr:CpsB/CapC family capsule biosynthesis tyrosine phosphatase [Caenimonas sp. SL110]